MADCRKPRLDVKKRPDRSTNSEESSSETSSSSESEHEVQCLMADETDEVFDFPNLEFTLMKPSGDKTGLDYNIDESSTTQTNSTPKLERTKFQTIKFVNSSMGQPAEAQSGETKIAVEPPIWQGRLCGLGYTAIEKPPGSWLTKKVEQMLAGAQRSSQPVGTYTAGSSPAPFKPRVPRGSACSIF
ncbi:ribonuclease P protein subunit p29-like [Dorcoceras hygrometricum]|uniref:Ribonuclease P protein subunit p29-like n=1 Tax=Dorcoceras hygrometricum TaxID=472368 RepID=A0A2Z7D5U2_9LAMI|nr:ribonuclease P protein subunit p29-like [Dorcoceras hygrometricum]